MTVALLIVAFLGMVGGLMALSVTLADGAPLRHVAWAGGVAAVSLVLLVVGVMRLAEGDDRRIQRQVQECLARGGTPDVYGRTGSRFMCHEVQP